VPLWMWELGRLREMPKNLVPGEYVPL
jgi:hypothetical protein